MQSARLGSLENPAEARAQTAEVRREQEKITQLQDQVIALREQLARSNADSKTNSLREKLAAANAVNSELRSRLRQLEEQVERRDQLVKDWNGSIGALEAELRRVADENQQLLREQDTVKSGLVDVQDYKTRLQA